MCCLTTFSSLSLGTLHEDRCTLLIISLSILLRKRNISENSRRENRSTHFVFDNFFFRNRAVYEKMWKNIVQPGQVTDDSVAHAHCMPDTLGYKRALRICNTHRCSTPTMVASTCLNITLYVHWLSCLNCRV